MIIKKLVGMLFVLSLSTVFVGCGDDDDDSVDVAASCERFCTKVAPLNCAGTPASTCVEDCKADASLVGQAPAKCQGQIATAAKCLDATPASNYECDDFDDEAVPKEGVCKAEQDAAVACVLAG